jgi:hypothetical protein
MVSIDEALRLLAGNHTPLPQHPRATRHVGYLGAHVARHLSVPVTEGQETRYRTSGMFAQADEH